MVNDSIARAVPFVITELQYPVLVSLFPSVSYGHLSLSQLAFSIQSHEGTNIRKQRVRRELFLSVDFKSVL